MYPTRVRAEATALLAEGRSVSEVARLLGAHRSTIRAWRITGPSTTTPGECPRCGPVALDEEAYAALLGFYLGDGCISAASRYFCLRVTCDDRYPAIMDDVEQLIERVRPRARVCRVAKAGCTDVQSNWKHWPCLFPQHGPGRKHERPIVLEDWQRSIVELHPGPFLRGLFHSDGCRAANWTAKDVAGERKRYDYPRWMFTNNSDEIRHLCTWALDLVGIPWRPTNRRTIAVSRREAVVRLDEIIGLKQ